MRLRYVVAALPLALGACGGDDEGGSPDAEPDFDAEVHDAAPPDAIPEGPVTVTVTAQGAGVMGVDVVFNNPDGTVNGVEQTGSGGQAPRDLQIGGSATIVVSPDMGTSFVGITFAAVEPGDQLAFEFEPPPTTDVGDFSATLPTGVVAGAVEYEVSLGCASTVTNNPALPVTGNITSDCLGSDNQIDAFVTALDNMGTPLAYDYVKDVAVAAVGNTNLVFDAWQTAGVPLQVTLNNVPAGVPGAGFEAHWRVDGIDFGGFGGGGGPPTGGTTTINSSYPSGSFVERLQYGIFYQYGSQPTDGLGIIIAGHADAPVAATHDLGALALPEISAAGASATAGRVSLTWTAEGALSSSDGGLVLMSWADATPGPTTDQWFVLIPPDAASPYELPEMPNDVSGFVPPAGATFATPTVIFGEGDYIDGYDDWRTGDGFIIFGDNAFEGIPATGGVFRATLGGALPGGGG
jgi:hypothetical protein